MADVFNVVYGVVQSRAIIMRKQILSVLFLVLSSLVCSCSHHESVHSGRIDLVVTNQIESVDDLSDIITDIEITPLKGEYALMLEGALKMKVLDPGYVVLSGGSPFYVGEDGNVVKQYGQKGRGPGEYILIRDFCTDISGKELWCLAQDNSIIRYDLYSYSYLGTTKIDLGSMSASGIVPVDDRSAALFIPNPSSESELSSFEEQFYCLRQYSLAGNLIDEDYVRTDFNISAAFVTPTSCSGDQRYILSPGCLEMPSLVFDKGIVSDSLVVDFGSEGLPFRYAIKEGENPWSKIGEIFMDDRYKLVNSIYDLGDIWYFSSYGTHSTVWNFLYNKASLKSVKWRSFGMMTWPIHPLASDGSCLYYIYSDYSPDMAEQERDPLKNYVIKNYSSSLEADTPVLLKVSVSV